MSYVTSFERIAKAEGKAEVLLQQYQAKFGPAPEAVERTIWEASPEQIQRGLQRILTATTPDELLEDP